MNQDLQIQFETVLQHILSASSSSAPLSSSSITSSSHQIVTKESKINTLERALSEIELLIVQNSTDTSQLPSLWLKRSMVKLSLASELLIGLEHAADHDRHNLSKAVSLLSEIIHGDKDNTKSDKLEFNANEPCAFACELTTFVHLHAASTTTVQERALHCASTAASSGFCTPLSHFLMFVQLLFKELDRELPSFNSCLPSSFEATAEYFSTTRKEKIESEPKFVFHLKRAAFGGLRDAQPLLSLALLYQGDEKWSMFVTHGLSSTLKQQLGKVQHSLNILWPIPNKSTTTIDDQWIQWVHHQRRESILHRMQQYCHNCLSIPCDDFGNKELKLTNRKFCSRCRLVQYCSIECQRIHWQNVHKHWCSSNNDNWCPAIVTSIPTRNVRSGTLERGRW